MIVRVKVIQCFACGSQVYPPGIHDLTPELADDLAELQRVGWVVVVEDAADPIHLTTPESGLQVLRR